MRTIESPTGPRDAADTVIQTRELTKVFSDDTGIHQVSLQVPRGTIFGFIGPSGCGKTTTVRLLTGVYRPSGGSALVLGVEPARFSQSARARIGYMPQNFVLYPDLTIGENLNFAASVYGVGVSRWRRARNVLEFVELHEHRRKLVRRISGGMQRRLSLAATLIHDPELLFLDEPTAGIDPVLRRKFWDHFQAMKAEGRTLFVTTQYVGEAAYCDLVGVMSNGHLLFVDTPRGLRQRAFGGALVDLRTDRRLDSGQRHQLEALPEVLGPPRIIGSNTLRITVEDAATAIPVIVGYCQQEGIEVESIQEYLPPFDDVFVELVKEEPIHG